MKVDGSSLSPIGSVQAVNRLGQVEKKKAVSNSEADQVAVSDKGQVYHNLLKKVKELPAVREEKVRNLAEQIKQGNFQIDARKIADKLSSFDF